MGAAPPPSQPTVRRRILVADDDHAIAMMLQRSLGRDYDIVVATDGPGAIALATHPPYPDLLLLDIMMPGIDGLGVARRVRLFPELKNTPIIFLTAKDTAMDVIRGIQAGARSYVTKPFSLPDLRDKVRRALGER